MSKHTRKSFEHKIVSRWERVTKYSSPTLPLCRLQKTMKTHFASRPPYKHSPSQSAAQTRASKKRKEKEESKEKKWRGKMPMQTRPTATSRWSAFSMRRRTWGFGSFKACWAKGTTFMLQFRRMASSLQFPASFFEDPFEVYCFFTYSRRFLRSLSSLLLAGEREIVEKIRDMEVVEDRLVVHSVEVLEYRSILESLKGCAAVFCCLDSSDGYNDVRKSFETRFISNRNWIVNTFGFKKRKKNSILFVGFFFRRRRMRIWRWEERSTWWRRARRPRASTRLCSALLLQLRYGRTTSRPRKTWTRGPGATRNSAGNWRYCGPLSGSNDQSMSMSIPPALTGITWSIYCDRRHLFDRRRLGSKPKRVRRLRGARRDSIIVFG